jgi:hypothetical protein
MLSKDNPNADLVLETLPNGEHAWLRPDRPRRTSLLARRFWLTTKGHDALAELRRDEALLERWSEAGVVS